ncbi:preprotein translocase subunit SecE [Patescibacteria group bacterium]
MNKVKNYLKEVKLELSKVTWPKKDQVIKLTLIVFIISGIVAIYVGGLDFIFTKALEFIVRR